MICAQRFGNLEQYTRKNADEKAKILKLHEWGKRSRGGLPDGRPGDGPTPAITDDDFIAVDLQVGKLFPGPRMIIQEIYKSGYGVNELSKVLGVSNQVIREYRDEGINMIWGALRNA